MSFEFKKAQRLYFEVKHKRKIKKKVTFQVQI